LKVAYWKMLMSNIWRELLLPLVVRMANWWCLDNESVSNNGSDWDCVMLWVVWRSAVVIWRLLTCNGCAVDARQPSAYWYGIFTTTTTMTSWRYSGRRVLRCCRLTGNESMDVWLCRARGRRQQTTGSSAVSAEWKLIQERGHEPRRTTASPWSGRDSAARPGSVPRRPR